MIEQANLKATGWQRVVAELNMPAGDDRAFAERLVRILAQVSAARQAVLYSPAASESQTPEPRIEMVWPPAAGPMDRDRGPAEAPSNSAMSAGGAGSDQVEFATEARRAAIGAFESGQAQVVSVDAKQPLYYDGGMGGGGAAGASGGVGSGGFVLSVPLLGPISQSGPVTGAGPGTSVQASIIGVITLLIEARTRDAVRSTLAMAEVLAGYTQGHAARLSLRRTQQAGQALELATRLIGSVNTAKSFKGACMQLVNDITRQFALDRTALGWVHDDSSKVLAISDIEHFDRRTQMVQKLASAMDECLDQEQPVMFPLPPAGGGGGDGAHGESGDVLLSQAIVHAHRELCAGNQKLKICSLPLRVDEAVVGVVTLESSGEGSIEVSGVELIQAALDLIAPVLKIRRSDDRILLFRAWDSTVNAAAWAVGTRHTVWKVVALASIATLLFLTFFRTTYRPGAEATLDPRTRRVVSSPFEGTIRSLGPNVEPGRRVELGETLVELDTTEYRLALADARAKVQQAEKQADAARAARQQDKVVQAEQQAKINQAEADVYEYRISRSKIVAPISGTIIAGEVKDKLGATVKTGDALFQIADLTDMIVTARVDERDIALVKKAFDESRGTGQIATKGKPDEPFSFTIERIVPLASALAGKNTFEVRGKLSGSADWMRPGMEGIAKFNTEQMSLMGILTRRARDQARLWLWW